jgi:hypothetical protein
MGKARCQVACMRVCKLVARTSAASAQHDRTSVAPMARSWADRAPACLHQMRLVGSLPGPGKSIASSVIIFVVFMAHSRPFCAV